MFFATLHFQLPIPGQNSWFIPDPNDPVHTHAGVSSPLTGSKSRSGASSLQTVGPPLHLLFQLLLLLLQATWHCKPGSALLPPTSFFSVGTIRRYDPRTYLAQCAFRLWMTAGHKATPLSYCKRLISHRHTRKKIPRRHLLENRTTVTQGLIRRITDSFLVIFHSCLLCKWQQRQGVLPASRLSTGEQLGCLHGLSHLPAHFWPLLHIAIKSWGCYSS